MTNLIPLLSSAYGIVPASCVPAPGGFSAKAYRVTGTDGTVYFLKVYDKALPTTRYFVERIAMYMPILDWLSALPHLRGRVLTPVRTQQETYKIEAADEIGVLFLFVEGAVPGVDGMTLPQTVELAEVLASLHDVGEDAPFEPDQEDTSLSFCERLEEYFDHADRTKHGALYDLTAPHEKMLRSAILEARQLRDAAESRQPPLVLCHGDAHGNNVIQSDRLVLADWEDLRMAPAEADLFIYAWHPFGDKLLEAYSAARRGYQIDTELLRFYVLRRRLEDVWVDIQRLTEEALTAEETAKQLDYVRRGIEEVRLLLS
jgi:aminoglycoside phosphotransferase (APT) family kinase protein